MGFLSLSTASRGVTGLEPRRFGGAIGVSVTLHILLAILIGIVVVGPAVQRTGQAIQKLDLVYFNDASRNGGGGRNPRPTPPQPTQIPQHQLSQPVPIATAVPLPDPPVPQLDARVETNDASRLQAAGTIVMALPGPGGTGPGSGLGPGRDKGVGPGSGRDQGGDSPLGGGHVNPPTIIRKIEPMYTPAAMLAKITGSVELDAIVLANGTVGTLRVTKSLGGDLDAAAIAAAKQWLFRPATREGRPVDVLVRLIIDFRLH
jgi:periplasmic protein TonB